MTGNVDTDISLMTGAVAVPRANGEVIFDAPWQSRSFAMAVDLSRRGLFSWDEFRTELAHAIAERDQHGVDEYYLSWLDALERLLQRHDVVTGEQVRDRAGALLRHELDEIF